MALLPEILDDWQKGDLLSDPTVVEDTWSALKDQDCLWRRGEPLSFAKFMSSQHKKRDFLHKWTATLFQLLYWGLLCGNIDKDNFKNLSQKKAMLFWQKLEPDAGKQQPLAEGNGEEQAKMKQITKSGYHTATMTLFNWENKIRQRILYCVGEPLTLWFTKMSKVMRSSDGARNFLASCVTGSSLADVAILTISLLQDESRLEYCGMSLDGELAAEGADALQHPQVLIHDEWASLLGRGVLRKVRRRFIRMLWLTRRWPARIAGFNNEGHEALVVDSLKEDWRLYRALCQRTDTKSRRMAGRSCFAQVSVKQLVRMLQRDNWRSSAEVKQFIKDRSGVNAGSQVIEDMFQRGRRAERTGGKLEINGSRLWAALIDKKITTEVHKYEALDESGVDEGRLKLPQGFYEAKVAGATPWLREVVSFQSATSWYSPSPDSWPEVAADMEWCKFADAQQAWDKVSVPPAASESPH